MRRGLSNNAEVLIGGRRYPLVGTVSMDNVTVDLGPGRSVAVGEEAVLIGKQGSEQILCEDGRRAPRHDQLRGDVRREREGAAGAPRGVRVERLDGAPAVTTVRAALEGISAAWLVGGTLRDALLERELRDVDLAVDADPKAAAHAVATAAGGPVFPLSETSSAAGAP